MDHPILQQFSVLSPFLSLPTSHQISPSPTVQLKPFSIWAKTSKQSLRSGHSPCALDLKTFSNSRGSVHPGQKLLSSQKLITRTMKTAEITMVLSQYIFGVLEPPKLQPSESLAFFWVLTPHHATTEALIWAQSSVRLYAIKGKKQGVVCIIRHQASHFWLAPLTKQHKCYLCHRHRYQVAFMKHRHILHRVPSLGEDGESWSLLCQQFQPANRHHQQCSPVLRPYRMRKIRQSNSITSLCWHINKCTIHVFLESTGCTLVP